MDATSAKKKAEAYITLANLIATTRPEIKREDYPSNISWMVALHKSTKLGEVEE